MTILDTLAIARDLKKSGFTEEQAEALANAVRQASGLPDISDLVTKADLKAGLADTKADILKWIIGLVVGMLAVNIGAMITLAKLLHTS